MKGVVKMRDWHGNIMPREAIADYLADLFITGMANRRDYPQDYKTAVKEIPEEMPRRVSSRRPRDPQLPLLLGQGFNYPLDFALDVYD